MFFIPKCDHTCLNIDFEGLEGSISFWSDDVIVCLGIRRRWCHDSGSNTGIVYIFRLLFPPPHAADEIHSCLSFSLSLSVSLSLFLMFRCLRLNMISLSHVFRYVQTQLYTRGASRRHPAVTDKIKKGAQT